MFIKKLWLLCGLFVMPCVVYAGKDRNVYKAQDLRQQQRRAQQAEKYLQKFTAKSTVRFDSRHLLKPQIINLSTKQKVLALFFVSLIGGASLVEASAINKIPKFQWPSIVHEISAEDWAKPRAAVYGPCDEVPRDGRSCCAIGPNCTITCYALDPSRYISFDIGRIIGDQSEANFNASGALIEARKICAQRPKTYKIAGETFRLLGQLETQHIQNVNGTHCIIEQPLPKGELCELPYGLLSCRTITDISFSGVIPSLVAMVNKFETKFNLRHMVQTFIHEDICRESAGATSFEEQKTGEQLQGIRMPYSVLLKNSDEEVEDILGHEIHHLKQFEYGLNTDDGMSIMGNDMELEADIASVLVNGNPCLAVWMEKFIWDDRFDMWELFHALQFTKNKELLDLIIKNKVFSHPPTPVRMSVILHVFEHFKKAQEVLQLTQEK